jgi:Predicted oxidoreductases (related to aryl-alcohol dehydrogenases)
MAQFAMRWILDQPAVTTIIPGASSPSQVAKNVAVSALAPLPAALHDDLYAFYLEHIENNIRCKI